MNIRAEVLKHLDQSPSVDYTVMYDNSDIDRPLRVKGIKVDLTDKNLLARAISDLWANPDFWKLVNRRATIPKIAKFIRERYFPLESAGNALEWADAVTDEGARRELLLGLIFDSRVRSYFKMQAKPCEVAKTLAIREVHQLLDDYLSDPVEDKRASIVERKFSPSQLEFLAQLFGRISQDVEWCHGNFRKFPNDAVQYSGRIKCLRTERVIDFIEMCVDELRENGEIPDYFIAQNAPEEFTKEAARKHAATARTLVEIRHVQSVTRNCQTRNGKKIGKKPAITATSHPKQLKFIRRSK